MVKAKSYTPTNKRFRRHFQDIAQTSTKKGHLGNQEREQEDIVAEKGILVRIDKNKLSTNGWEVEVGVGDDKKTYNCVNGTGELTMPECIESQQYFTPKLTTSVDVLLDNVSKIYTITRIRSLNKVMMGDPSSVKIGLPQEEESTDTTSEIVLNRSNIQITNSVIVDGNIEAQNIKGMEEKIRQLENLVYSLIDSDDVEYKNLLESNSNKGD